MPIARRLLALFSVTYIDNSDARVQYPDYAIIRGGSQRLLSLAATMVQRLNTASESFIEKERENRRFTI